MNRIDQRFEELKATGGKALVCFLTAGDPSMEATAKLVKAIAGSGADIVEIGVPFSDPLADGPVIQASTHRALHKGASVRKVLDTVKQIRQDCQVPIVLMTYFNPVNSYGLDKFAKDAAEAGTDGVIMTDLPIEEASEWVKAATDASLATIFLLAPTSTDERIELTAKYAGGFVYCITRTGVTGARSDVPPDTANLIARIRRYTDLPVAAGFGISKPEHMQAIKQYADGAVVGSALVNLIAESASVDEAVKKASLYVRSLKEALES